MSGTQPEEDGPDAENRGRRATISPNGAVHGSGAGAGGGGTPEDIDSDPASGSGADIEPRVTAVPDAGADAPRHGGR